MRYNYKFSLWSVLSPHRFVHYWCGDNTDQRLNESILQFNLNTIKVKSCVYIDKNDSFTKELTLNNVIEVDNDRSITLHTIN